MEHPPTIERKIRTFLELKKSLEGNLRKAFDHESLIPLRKSIAEKTSQIENLLSAFSARTSNDKFNPLSGDLPLSDDLSDNLPSGERLRRQQARILARKLYSRYHEDRAEGKGHMVDFDGLRQLVNSGELEVIQYLRWHYERGEPPANLEALLEVRMARLQALPSFRLVSLYLSGSGDFEREARKVLLNKLALVEQRLADLYILASQDHETSAIQG